ncbi:hypothetical protein G7046_g3938 [Stylonectria norvegica]|nr:hypothetical protein G7046_g3938 [Stylonectria norvegica]
MVGMRRYNFPGPPILCGCFILVNQVRKYLPQVQVDAHTTILASTSRTTLTQTFTSPRSQKALDEVRYVFPLYDGVSVVAFTCTVGSRVIKGVVKERQQAKQVYQEATARGEMAGLLEQSLEAADVFTTTIGNVAAGEKIKVEITYLGELKHDAQVDGVRFTIPTSIVPRYGAADSLLETPLAKGGLSITVDAEMPGGSAIKSIQSPSHPISVNIGTTSTALEAEPSLQKASATLALESAELTKDFIIQVVATNLGNPTAVLELHPTIPNQRALMATLVPKFNLPAEKPEIVFICDRSGSMNGKIKNLIEALRVFLKSMPVGVKFNICSFGTGHDFLWPKSQTYSQESLNKATKHVEGFSANYGGTQIYEPMKETFLRRYKDMNLEVFLLTDGEIWHQEQLFELINDNVAESKGAIRVFSLGVGSGASSSLIEGVARAGKGFAQTVFDDEKMDKKVVRMLKGALFPHITDYSLQIKYEKADTSVNEDDFEIVESVMDALEIDVAAEKTEESASTKVKKPISLFNTDSKGDDIDMVDAPPSVDTKYDHLPAVPVPRYLQTPSEIPPLFPFNRTTIYVLFSDSTPNQCPKSVVLKGTSTHGPLELEIPITELAEKSATIHQLAARKEVKELEEGRGWISHAKSAGGKLLKEEYEGRFSDMVEREAVRLGVGYQVGGKWCSFVAVQDSDETIVDEVQVSRKDNSDKQAPVGHMFAARAMSSFAPPPPPAAPLNIGNPSASRGPSFFGNTNARGGDVYHSKAAFSYGSSSPPGGGPRLRSAPKADTRSTDGSSGGLFGSRSTQGPTASMFGNPASAAPSTRPLGSLFSGALFGGVAPAAAPASHSTASSGGLFGGADLASPSFGNTNAAPSGGLFGQPAPTVQVDNALLEQYRLESDESAARPLPDELSSDEDMGSPLSPPESKKKKKKKQTAASVESSNLLQDLISLQTFVGSWAWSSKLTNILGVTSLKALELGLPSSVHGDVLATLCAVVFLKKKLADEEDAWEMLVDKAENWLQDQTGGDLEALEKAVEGLF